MVRARSIFEIECVTDMIVKKFSPATLEGKQPFNVLGFIDGPLEEMYGIDYDVQELGPNVEGKLEDNTLVLNTPVYRGLVQNLNRDRFTGAHEIGHGVLHAKELKALNDGARGLPALYRRDTIKPYLDPEWQANTFAAGLLMPAAGVVARLSLAQWLSPAFAAAVVSQTFAVSQAAAELRIKKLIEKGVLKL